MGLSSGRSIWNGVWLLVLATGLSATGLFAADPPSKTLDGWGDVVNRRRDCKLDLQEGVLTINVPGTPHNLNKVISDLNAPRVLQEVEGDFTIQVKVSGDFTPSPRSTVAPRGKAFNGAGLLLWVDESQFIRLERNIWINGDGSADCHPPLFDLILNGVPQEKSPAPVPATFFSTPETWLRLERKGEVVVGSLSHDGSAWQKAGEITAKLPAKVSAGVAAVNTSRKPFKAVFAELKIDR